MRKIELPTQQVYEMVACILSFKVLPFKQRSAVADSLVFKLPPLHKPKRWLPFPRFPRRKLISKANVGDKAKNKMMAGGSKMAADNQHVTKR